MAPRKSTIAKKLNEVIDSLKSEKRSAEKRVESALKRLEKLADSMDGVEAKKRPPSEYIKFVKANYSAVKKANPDVEATKIMKLIAQKWNAKKDGKPAPAKKAAPKKAAPKKKSSK